MKVCIVGAGAIGGTIGAHLSSAGQEVSLIARGAHLAALRERGLRFIDPRERSSVFRLPASDAPADFPVQDVVVIALKTHGIAAMAPHLAPLIGPETLIVPAINGLAWWSVPALRDGAAILDEVDPHEVLRRHLPSRQIIGCVVHMASDMPEPGCIRNMAGTRLVIGEPDHTVSDRLERLAAMLSNAGLRIDATNDIHTALWTKLTGNFAFNPVGAITQLTMEEMLSDPFLVEVPRAMLGECMAVAASQGIHVPITVEERIEMARKVGSFRVSTLQDIEAGRRIEYEALVGHVLTLGRMAGIAMPIARTTAALLCARARHLGCL